MLPLTVGFLIAGPASGAVSDRFGARAFATGGLLLTALTFVGLIALPANFNYVEFAALLALNGIGMGLMAAPNSAAIMNAVVDALAPLGILDIDMPATSECVWRAMASCGKPSVMS